MNKFRGGKMQEDPFLEIYPVSKERCQVAYSSEHPELIMHLAPFISYFR